MLSLKKVRDALEPLAPGECLSPRQWVDRLNFGKAVAIVDLLDCKKIYKLPLEEKLEYEKHLGDYNISRYAWKLNMIDNAFLPFPVKGTQGFFNVGLNEALIYKKELKGAL